MKTKKVTCDQCDVLVINNVICHEHGCPNAWRDSIVECGWCGKKFSPDFSDQHFCDEECLNAYYGIETGYEELEDDETVE
jgi:hypothetical protein